MDRSIRVLHVDDDSGFSELVAEFLEQTDERLDVTSAGSADEGLQRLRAAPDEIDCIVSDYDMPRQNGIDFLETVRRDFPDLPFMLFTGKGSEEVASEAISAGATDYLQKDSGTEQYEILANRIGNAVEQFRSTRRAENLERLRNLSAEVNHELIRAETREAVEETVCETMSDTDPYRFAWIGAVDEDSARVVPRVKAGEEDGYLEAVSVPSGEDDAPSGPAAVAVQEERVAVSQDIENDPAFEPWCEEALDRNFRAVAATPLVYDSTLYGVLVVYATRANVFDEAEQALLEELGDDVAHAVHARQVRSNLEEFRALLDSANDAIYMLEPESGQFLELNERARRRLGYDREALLDMSIVDVERTLEDRAAYRQVVDRIRNEGSVLMEGVHEAADGSTFPVEVQADYVTVNDRDYVVAIARDITEKRQRQTRLQQQRDALFELTTEPTVTDGDFESAVERITETAASVLDVPRVNVWLFEEDETTLRCVDNFDESSGTHDRGARLHTESFPVYFEALRTNRTIEAASARRDPRTRELTDDYLRPNNVEALLDATLRSEGEVAGVVCVENVGSTREWTEDEVEFVSDIADIVDRAHRNQQTRQRKRELELRERAIEEAPVGITITDYQRPDNPITYVNAKFCEITGYERDEVLEENHRFLQGPGTSEPPVDEMRRAIAANEPTSVELRNYRRDDEEFWNRVSFAPVHDDDGTVTNWVGFQEDVTDRKEREQLLETVLENTTTPMFMKNRDGEYLLINSAFKQLFDLEETDVLGRTDEELFPDRMAEEVRRKDRAALESGEPQEFEERIVVDGEERIFLSSKTPIDDLGSGADADRPQAIFGVASDITDRKRREESLERQSERFDELAKVVSHDLQTPLSTAIARAELATETGDVEQMEKALAAIRRTDTLRTDLVDVLRTQELVSETERVDVAAAVDTVQSSITAAEGSSVAVDGAPVVDGDPGAVKRLIENLLSNAVEHGGDDVSVRVGELEDGFYVADDGPGIAPENRDDVFTPGFSTKEQGTGVGLASVREIVLAHGWSISITEGEAGGARFEIRTGNSVVDG